MILGKSYAYACMHGSKLELVEQMSHGLLDRELAIHCKVHVDVVLPRPPRA